MSTMFGDAQDLKLSLGPRYTRTSIVECAQPASGFESLPEANFRQLLALLPLSQRIRSAELVSKRWRQALRDQEVLSVVDFASDSLWRNQVSTKLFDHLVTRSTTAYKQGIQNSLTRKLVLTDCRLVPGAGPPMMFILHCLHHCFHLEVIEATGFGGIGGAFHMNDLLVLLRTMNKMRPAPQLKEIWIDAWCPTLTCTWESSAYQRAIAVDALWLTFMRMLEPGSRIKVRNIFCVHDEGDGLRPSEVARTLNMRIHKLVAALTNGTHHMQFFFVVKDGLERSIVQQVMGLHPNVECREQAPCDLGEFRKMSPDLSCTHTGTTLFRAKSAAAC